MLEKVLHMHTQLVIVPLFSLKKSLPFSECCFHIVHLPTTLNSAQQFFDAMDTAIIGAGSKAIVLLCYPKAISLLQTVIVNS